MTVGIVAVNYVPMMMTFDEDLVEFAANNVALIMERTLVYNSLFGDFGYEEDYDKEE